MISVSRKSAACSATLLRLKALNDYQVDMPWEDPQRFDVLLALRLDDQPMGVRDGVDHYSMRFYIREYNLRRRIVEQVWLAVAKHLAREDMPIAPPRQVVDQHTRQPETPPDASPA